MQVISEDVARLSNNFNRMPCLHDSLLLTKLFAYTHRLQYGVPHTPVEPADIPLCNNLVRQPLPAVFHQRQKPILPQEALVVLYAKGADLETFFFLPLAFFLPCGVLAVASEFHPHPFSVKRAYLSEGIPAFRFLPNCFAFGSRQCFTHLHDQSNHVLFGYGPSILLL